MRIIIDLNLRPILFCSMLVIALILSCILCSSFLRDTKMVHCPNIQWMRTQLKHIHTRMGWLQPLLSWLHIQTISDRLLQRVLSRTHESLSHFPGLCLELYSASWLLQGLYNPQKRKSCMWLLSLTGKNLTGSSSREQSEERLLHCLPYKRKLLTFCFFSRSSHSEFHQLEKQPILQSQVRVH